MSIDYQSGSAVEYPTLLAITRGRSPAYQLEQALAGEAEALLKRVMAEPAGGAADALAAGERLENALAAVSAASSAAPNAAYCR